MDPIRLVVTEEWADRPLYATLSHCWGQIEFETLKKTNLEYLKHGIPSAFLTKTFADAVQIARAVGLSYLWIDSLCIIQDSHQDWEAEASMMASVYGGSSLNIAASSARDGSEGCFLKPLNHAGGFTTRICTNGKMETVEFSTGDEYIANVTQSHLATRGWTVQEKILPPRTLHCGDQGLFWDCRTERASEYFPHGFSEKNWELNKAGVRWDDSNPKAIWKSLVYWYSGCHLTKAGDKLVALSGVARAIQAKTGDQYCAGLWRNTLEQELCWTAVDPQQRPQYRAPSWSWAAVDGPVDFDNCQADDVYYAHVSSVSIIHPGKDNFGPVSHGALSVRCDAIVVGTIVAKDVARAKRKSCQSADQITDFDEERGICFSSLGQTGHVIPFRLDCVEQSDSRVGQTIYYVPLRARACGRHCSCGLPQEMNSHTLSGLVMERTNMTLNQYNRIGSFEHSIGVHHEHSDDLECSLVYDYDNFMEAVRSSSPCNSGGQTVNIV